MSQQGLEREDTLLSPPPCPNDADSTSNGKECSSVAHPRAEGGEVEATVVAGIDHNGDDAMPQLTAFSPKHVDDAADDTALRGGETAEATDDASQLPEETDSKQPRTTSSPLSSSASYQIVVSEAEKQQQLRQQRVPIVKKKSMFASSSSSSDSSDNDDDTNSSSSSNSERKTSSGQLLRKPSYPGSSPLSRISSMRTGSNVPPLLPASVGSGGGSTFKVTRTMGTNRKNSAAANASSAVGSPDPAARGSQRFNQEDDSQQQQCNSMSGVLLTTPNTSNEATNNTSPNARVLASSAPSSSASSLAQPSRSRFNSVANFGRAGSPVFGNSTAAVNSNLTSHGLVEFASRPISAVESIVFKGSSDFTISGKQSTKMNIRGKPHHVTTVLAKPNNLLGGPSSPFVSTDNVTAERQSYRIPQSSSNDSIFFAGANSSAAYNDPNNNASPSDMLMLSNNSMYPSLSNNSNLASNSNFSSPVGGAGGGAGNSNAAFTTTTTSSAALSRHHIVMGFGDEYEGEVVRVGPDWIPHGQGVLQSVLGQHCFVGTFRMKKREGRGKLATPRFVLWSEWKDNRPDSTHSARIDNCLTGERYRGNYRIVTDTAALNAMGSSKKPQDLQISKFSQWLQCSSIEYCKFGELVSQNGTRYFGEWNKGQQTGFGVQVFPNGDRYVGLFEKGLYHGNGTYFTYKKPRVCEDCERREVAFESDEAALDVAQAQSLLLRRVESLVRAANEKKTNGDDPQSQREERQRTLADIYEIITRGSRDDSHHHNDHASAYTYAVTGSGDGGSQATGFPNCGLAEKLTQIGVDGTVYDGLWEKGCFKGEGSHVTLPDRTRITADWFSVAKAENGHIFGPSMEEKTRKWQEHFHWEPLLSAAPQERKDREYDAMAKIRQQLRFCPDKRAFDTVIASDVVRGTRSIVNAIKMFRRCFYASFGTCGALNCVGAGGGSTSGIPTASLYGGGNAGGGVSSPNNNGPIDAARANLGWCKAHKTDFGGCIHIGKGRRITTTDVKNALSDVFSFVSSVQRYVEEMLEDNHEEANEYDEKYFEERAKIVELSAEGGFPSAVGRTISGIGGSTNDLSSAGGAAHTTTSTAFSTSAPANNSNNNGQPTTVVITDMASRVFDNALDAYNEYEGVALIHREVFDAAMREVHDILHNLYVHAYASENRAVHVALQRLAGITLDDLGVNFGRHSAEEKLFDPYAEATRALESITRFKSVSGKLKCLRQWSQAIDVSTRLAQVKLLDEQLAHARSQTTMVVTKTTNNTNNDGPLASPSSSTGTDPSGTFGGSTTTTTTTTTSLAKVKAIESGSADDLLPIHQYVLMNASVPDLLVEVKLLLDVTADPHLIDVTSQDSFCITTLQACVSSIPQMDLAVRDEAAIVTPCAMFAHRAEEALLSAATCLPSEGLTEYGYLRDAIAVMLGVLPEFPSLTLPLRLEGPSAFPMDTFDYVRSWVPALLNVLFVHVDTSAAAFEWRRWQTAHKHEEGKRKSSVVGGSAANNSAAASLSQPPRLLLPAEILEEGLPSSPSSSTSSIIEAIFGPFVGILGSQQHQQRQEHDRRRGFEGGGATTSSSRSSSCISGSSSMDLSATAGFNNNDFSFAAARQQQPFPVDDGSIDSSVRIAVLREALFAQKKIGLDDTHRNLEALVRIAKDPSCWPPPPPANGNIIGDSTTVGSAAGTKLGTPPTSTTNAASGLNNSGRTASSDDSTFFRSASFQQQQQQPPESEVSIILRSLAPKEHVWSELYVDDIDLLAYQIKNAIAAGKLFANLNRSDMQTVWYLSLTREERRVLRFGKKLLASVRCLSAVNVHVCVDVNALPPLPALFKRTVEDNTTSDAAASSPLSPTPAAASGGVAAAVTRTHSLGLGAQLPPTSCADAASSPTYVSLLELFPSKLGKIEEMKALLAVSARLAVLVEESAKESRSVVNAATASSAAPIIINPPTTIASTVDRPSLSHSADAGDDDFDSDDKASTCSDWSLDFEEAGDASNTEENASAAAAAEKVNQAVQHVPSPLSKHFRLVMNVVHDASVYVEVARALLRCDPREKN